MLRTEVQSNMVEVLDSELLQAPVPYRPTPPVSHLDRMARLASTIARELTPVECPVVDHFGDGVYMREMRIPSGAVVVGKIHKYENLLLMLGGIAELRDGHNRTRVTAPCSWVSPPGVQRAVLALTNCVFVSVHYTDLKNVDEIEAKFIAQNAIEYEQFLLENKPQGD